MMSSRRLSHECNACRVKGVLIVVTRHRLPGRVQAWLSLERAATEESRVIRLAFAGFSVPMGSVLAPDLFENLFVR